MVVDGMYGVAGDVGRLAGFGGGAIEVRWRRGCSAKGGGLAQAGCFCLPHRCAMDRIFLASLGSRLAVDFWLCLVYFHLIWWCFPSMWWCFPLRWRWFSLPVRRCL
ncbi:hypothetical protein QQ045_022506 [Rhodiola kirilowii]